MKKVLLPFLLLFIVSSLQSQTTFYVAADGNDKNSGKSEKEPWRTLEQVNKAFKEKIIVDKDVIRLRRGDVFLGCLRILRHGITITNYGSKEKGKEVIPIKVEPKKEPKQEGEITSVALDNPVITGLVSIPAQWEETSERSDIFKVSLANLPQPPATDLILVVKNMERSHPLKLGRYPNDEPAEYDRPSQPREYYIEINQGGYMNYRTIIPRTLTAEEQQAGLLTAGTVTVELESRRPRLEESDLRDAEICVRATNYTLDRYKITSYDNETGIIDYKSIDGLQSNTGSQLYIQPADGNNANGTTTPYFGYFLQNALRFADRYGEWYYDRETQILYLSQRNLQSIMYNKVENPNDSLYYVSTEQQLMDFNAGGTPVNDFTVDGIDFEGANESAIVAKDSRGATVINCNFKNIGSRGIKFYNVRNVNISGCTFENCLSSAIQAQMPYGLNTDFCNIQNCNISNVAPFVGMSSHYDVADNNAILAMVGQTESNHALISGNIIQNAGKTGIYWQGTGVTITNNAIFNTVINLQDVGAIYTYWNDGYPNPNHYVNRVISNNILGNMIGQPYGASRNRLASGVYLDGKTRNVDVTDNTIFNAARRGIVANHPGNINLRGNTLFNNVTGINIAKWVQAGCITGEPQINADHNTVYSTNPDYDNIAYQNNALNYSNTDNTLDPTIPPVQELLGNAIHSVGVIDNNHYGMIKEHSFNTDALNYVSSGETNCSRIYAPGTSNTRGLFTSAHCFQNWKDLGGQDQHSTTLPKYRLYDVTGIVENPANSGNDLDASFEDGNLYNAQVQVGANPPTALSIYTDPDNGAKSLLINMPDPVITSTEKFTDRNIFFSNTAASIGQKYFDHTYLLRFRAKGLNSNGKIRVTMRTNSSGNTINNINYGGKFMCKPQEALFNTESRDYEFLLVPDLNFMRSLFPLGGIPVYERPASLLAYFLIQVEGNSDDFYLDDVSFHEVTADIHDPSEFVVFKYNAERTEIPFDIPDGDYEDALQTPYSGGNRVTLAPFSSLLLFRINDDHAGRRRPVAVRPATSNTASTLSQKPAVCFPNPAKNMLNIRSAAGSNWQTMEITDMAGRRTGIVQNINGNNLVQTNISSLAKGTYLVLLKKQGGKTAVMKFVKQ
ncbi:MAG: T9SS type A sorting domain-containing protein [Ferruginibacter sp.]